MSPKQFGFKKNVSTEIALSDVYETLIKNFENNHITCSVFLDISKAFDSVNHKLLLKKLNLYGIRGIPYDLLKSYLTDRHQYTLIDGSASSLLPINCGVPQGSVLGPFLFSVFVNDLPNITRLKTTLFADDACFSFGHSDSEFIESYVNVELQQISKWYSDNKLALNVDKSNFILIHRKKNPVNIALTLNNANIERLTHVKYLGVTIDERLDWKAHIHNCTMKLNKCLWAVTKLRRYASVSTLKLVYYALAYPYIQYCIAVWGGAPKTSLQPLLVKQKRIIRVMLKEPNISPSSPLFAKLDLLKLQEIYNYKIGIFMQKKIKQKAGIQQNLSLISSVHNHNTRLNNSSNFYMSSVSSNLGKTAFSYCGPRVWNTIPSEIRNATEFNFKSLYKEHLLQNYLV